MGEAAMMSEAEDRIFEVSEDVDIRRFRRQRHRSRGQRRLPVEPGTGKAGSSKKVSDRFQAYRSAGVSPAVPKLMSIISHDCKTEC